MIRNLASTTEVSAGASHSLALHQDGTIWAVGRNQAGQLGSGTNMDSSTPVAVLGASAPISGITSVRVGSLHSLALDNTGKVWAWGSNANGRLGDGTTVSRNRAVAVQDSIGILQGAEEVCAGDGFSLAIRGGVVLAWGQNNFAQLGDGSSVDKRKAVEVQTASGNLSGVVAVSSGANHGVALKADGTVWTWGQNNLGQLGLNDLTNRSRATQIPDINDALAVAAGASQTYILRSALGGSVWATGANGVGQLGDGTTANRRSLVKVLGPDGPLTGIGWICAGSLSQHACAGRLNGSSWIWGSNSHGQLGEAAPGFAMKARPVPQELEPMALGSQSSFARSELGSWFGTGSRLFGQLGDGVFGLSNLAVTVRGISFALSALDSDGDAVPDWLELSAGSNPDLADADKDGIADASDAYPNDFYNGVSPILTALSPQNQAGSPGAQLSMPLIVKVTNNGIPVSGAPVTFAFAFNGLFPGTSDTKLSNVLTVRADDLGRAQCFVKLPSEEGTYILTAQAGGSSIAFQFSAEFPPNKKPPTKPAWQSTKATTTSTFLRWSSSVDFFGEAINTYLVFRNDVQVATTSRQSWTDWNLTPGQSYNYRIVARDKRWNLASNAVQSITTAPQATLPPPWLATDIGVPALGSGSEVWQNDEVVIASGGRDIMSTHRFVYREFEGDFAISTKVDFLEATAIWAKAGLVVTGNLDPTSPRIVYAMSGGRDAQIQVRAQSGGGSDARTTPEVKAPGWLRIERTGSTWVFSASFDGERWFITGQQELALPESVLLGLAVASSDATRFCTALFSDVVFENRLDSDGDGLADTEELTSGTNPETGDSDGDGIGDFTESRVFFSNPLVADVGEVSVIQNLAATARVASLGRWAVGNGVLSARDERGWVEFDITVPAAGIYRLVLNVSELTNPTGDPYHDFSFWVDGVYADRSRIRLSYNQPGAAQVMTPFLQPGTHRVRVLWDNTLTSRRIALHGLRVESFEDLGWVATRLGRINGVSHPASGVISTAVSPLIIEGWSRFPETVTVLDGNDLERAVQPLPADSWFAELPLNTDGTTMADVSFENDGRIIPIEATWVPIDLLDPASGDQILRLADKLRMAVPGSSPDRVGTISIRRTTEQAPAWEYATSGESIVHAFEQSGEFVVTASLPATNAEVAVVRSLTVLVENSKLASDLVVTAGTPAQWPQPFLAAVVPVQFDARLAFQEVPVGALPRVFRVGSSSAVPLHVAARTEEGGRVLDSATVKAVKVSSSMETSMKVVDTLLDGSEIVEMPVLVSDVVPGMTMTLRIVVAGVTFDDGSLVRVLTAADFDELGRAKVRFIRNNGVSTSSCYTLDVQYTP